MIEAEFDRQVRENDGFQSAEPMADAVLALLQQKEGKG